MLAARHFHIDSQIVHETIDEETIVINLRSGTYFSLTGAGPRIWRWLLEGRSEREILDLAGDEEHELRESIIAFIQTLESDGVIQGSPRTSAAAALPALRLTEPLPRPELDRFTDMQQLLLLDPIHEVEPTGWPQASPEAETPHVPTGPSRAG